MSPEWCVQLCAVIGLLVYTPVRLSFALQNIAKQTRVEQPGLLTRMNGWIHYIYSIEKLNTRHKCSKLKNAMRNDHCKPRRKNFLANKNYEMWKIVFLKIDTYRISKHLFLLFLSFFYRLNISCVIGYTFKHLINRCFFSFSLVLLGSAWDGCSGQRSFSLVWFQKYCTFFYWSTINKMCLD